MSAPGGKSLNVPREAPITYIKQGVMSGMTQNICPICDEVISQPHDCMSYDSIRYSLELEFLGLTEELLQPYNQAGGQDGTATAERPPLRYPSEPYAPNVVQEQYVSYAERDNGYIPRDIIGRPVPHFLRL